MTERVVIGSDAVVASPLFTSVDETATDTTGAPTCTVVSRVTGATLTAPNITTLTAAGAYTADLTAAVHTVALDILDLTWSGTVAGKTRRMTQVVEVVGGFYDSIPSLRTITSLSDTATRPTALLRKFRAEIEDKCEEARGTAYVQRVAIETITTGKARVARRHPGTILAISIDDTACTPGDYTIDPVTRDITLDDGDVVTWSKSLRIAYVHGYTQPPVALVEACREFVRAKVITDTTDLNRNPSSVTNLATQEVYRFTTADPKFGRWTGLESVDSRINSVPDERVLVG